MVKSPYLCRLIPVVCTVDTRGVIVDYLNKTLREESKKENKQ